MTSLAAKDVTGAVATLEPSFIFLALALDLDEENQKNDGDHADDDTTTIPRCCSACSLTCHLHVKVDPFQLSNMTLAAGSWWCQSRWRSRSLLDLGGELPSNQLGNP